MPVSEQYLTALRARALEDLTARCTILTPGESTENDMGETLPGADVEVTDIPCRVISAASVTGRERQRLAASALGQTTNWLIILPWNQPITSKARITVTDPEPARTFEVTQVAGPHTEEIRRVVWVDEIT